MAPDIETRERVNNKVQNHTKQFKLWDNTPLLFIINCWLRVLPPKRALPPKPNLERFFRLPSLSDKQAEKMSSYFCKSLLSMIIFMVVAESAFVVDELAVAGRIAILKTGFDAYCTSHPTPMQSEPDALPRWWYLFVESEQDAFDYLYKCKTQHGYWNSKFDIDWYLNDAFERLKLTAKLCARSVSQPCYMLDHAFYFHYYKRLHARASI